MLRDEEEVRGRVITDKTLVELLRLSSNESISNGLEIFGV